MSPQPKVLMKIESPYPTNRHGLTSTQIIIVVALLALLTALTIANFIRAREISQKNNCIENLKQIDGAKATWVMEKKGLVGAIPLETALYGPRAYIRDTPKCYGNGTYTIGPAGTKPTCSIPGHTL